MIGFHGYDNKSVFDYIEYDSDVERIFAAALDQRQDIKLFIKLPPWFLISTPVGAYNPDWAIIKQNISDDCEGRRKKNDKTNQRHVFRTIILISSW